MTPGRNNDNGKTSRSRRSIPLFNSPKIRRSLAHGLEFTPVNDQFNDKLTRSSSLELEKQTPLLNNDEEELRERQRQRATELQQQQLSSPTTDVIDRRKSMGPATGMTNAAIVEHYSNCIKLSAENKINMKNAFNLQLIDCMSEMLRKKDPEMNNFQAASCTLDASTKIYAYRVDCVHNDTLKMAGGLGRTEAQGQDFPLPHDGETDDPSKTKKKSRKKNKKTIETNVDSLKLSKFDMEYDVDPLFKKNAAMLDEGRNGGVNFLTSLILKDDGCQLVLDSDSMCYSTDPDSQKVETQEKSFIPPVIGLESVEICPSLKGFSFTSWDPSDEDLIGHLQSPTKRKLNDYVVPELPEGSDDHAFDIDAVPEAGFANDTEMDTHLGMEDIDEDEGSDRQLNGVSNLNPLSIGAKQLGIVELKDQLSSLPQEYSYFGAAARLAWAGPLHWRFKQGPKPGDGNRDTKKKRRKEPLTMEFEKIPEFGNAFNPAKNTSKLTTNTLIQWLPEKVTLPEDLHFDLKEFTQSFTRPMLSVRQKKGAVSSSQDLEDILSPYDYGNRNDADNFCPVAGSMDDDDDHHDAGMTFGDQTDLFSQNSQNDVTKQTGQFTGDNLVVAPNMVNKIQINYARVAKKMDMRKLKSTMWNMLNQEADESKVEAAKSKPFSETYQEIPNLLSQKMADNLSVALAFSALLHLANENSLYLDQSYGSLADFTIVHPK